jgi:hypothetical protein
MNSWGISKAEGAGENRRGFFEGVRLGKVARSRMAVKCGSASQNKKLNRTTLRGNLKMSNVRSKM